LVAVILALAVLIVATYQGRLDGKFDAPAQPLPLIVRSALDAAITAGERM